MQINLNKQDTPQKQQSDNFELVPTPGQKEEFKGVDSNVLSNSEAGRFSFGQNKLGTGLKLEEIEIEDPANTTE